MSARRTARTLGTLMLVGGVALLAWVVVVWQWQDPFTALYTTWKQHQLSQSYDERVRDYRPPAQIASIARAQAATRAAAIAAQVRAEARQYRRDSKRGEAIGRLRVPRLGLNMVLVDGTDDGSLQKGPGLDRRTYMPGEGQLSYIAGHRTTYLAPFAHIERMRKNDPVTIELPYATFVYRVFRTQIVPAGDLAALRSGGREIVKLQACHPRFFASHRYIVSARLVRIAPRGEPAIAAPPRVLAAAPLAGSEG